MSWLELDQGELWLQEMEAEAQISREEQNDFTVITTCISCLEPRDTDDNKLCTGCARLNTMAGGALLPLLRSY